MASNVLASRVERIFHRLRSKDSDQQNTAVCELMDYLSTDTEIDSREKVWDDSEISRRVFELTHSQHKHEVLGGLAAIGGLVSIDIEDIQSQLKLFRFWNHVRHLLRDHDIDIMLAVSRVLGDITQRGAVAFGEPFVDKEVPAALEMMLSDKEDTRFAGVLILKELARNCPVHFLPHMGHVLEKINVSLQDRRRITREGAAEVLGICLEMILERENAIRIKHLSMIFYNAQNNLKNSQSEIIHGSLLVYHELLLHARMFMFERFLDTATQVLRLKSHSNALVREVVIKIIPSLAAYDTVIFSERFLHEAVSHLLATSEKPDERTSAFLAIGNTAKVVGSDMKPFLEAIMTQIKQGFQERRNKNAPSEEPIFQCVGMLASAMGPNLTKLVYDQLDLMLACGLSEPLRQALSEITQNIPPLLRDIQHRLLDLLSITLSGKPYKRLGPPPSSGRWENLALNSAQVSTREQSSDVLLLALQTLSSFDFNGHSLSEFVHANVLPLLQHDRPEIRRSAVFTSCRLFVRDPICFQESGHAIEVMSDFLDKLLPVAITDPDASIRNTVLSSLHVNFDKHLAQNEYTQTLFFALRDESMENRRIAVELIGRVGNRNPARVVPSIRKTLIQLLTELEFSTTSRTREECTQLLALLVKATQRVIEPYALPMLDVLIQRANDDNPSVAANLLVCIEELADICGEDAVLYVPRLMQLIIACLASSSLPKRDAALRTLGRVCSSTGYVIAPLTDYPQILEHLGRILRMDRRQFVRREVFRVLGIMGAPDAYWRKIRPDAEASETALTIVNRVPVKQKDKPLSMNDDFETPAFTALLSTLNDQSLQSYHVTAIEAIISIFNLQGPRRLTFLSEVMHAFVTVTRASTVHRDFYLEQLTALVEIVKQHVRNFIPDIIGLIIELWEEDQSPIVVLLEALGKTLPTELVPFLPTLLPLMLRVFDGEIANEKKMITQIKLFDVFMTFGTIIEAYLQLVIPIIVKSFERADLSDSLREKALQTIDSMSKRIDLTDFASQIILSLISVLDTSKSEMKMAAMNTLCSLVLQLGPSFVVFVPAISKVTLRNRLCHVRYENLLSKIMNDEHPTRGFDDVNVSRENERNVDKFSTRFLVNQRQLKQVWDVSTVSTRDDWIWWMQRLSVELTKESTSPALRVCRSLVDNHPPLAKELFNAAFLSCWIDLYNRYQEDLVRNIYCAMVSPTMPPELMHRLLNLAEFMEHEEKPLPIEHTTLSKYAMRHMAYAKALYYKELEYLSEPSPAVIESLISINARLQQHDAAWGTLLISREQYPEHEEWYERLGQWQETLAVYERKAETNPDDPFVQIGMMRSLHALGEWDQLATQVEKAWSNARYELRRAIAPLAVAAAWYLHDWDLIDEYTSVMRIDSPDRAFYQAVLAVHRCQFPKASSHINKVRDLLDPELSSFIGEGYYGRSYSGMIRAQMLSELEEVIEYKQCGDQPERQEAMKRTWMKRLRGCQDDVEVWRRILQVRTLVLDPKDHPDMWIKFANLCRKSEHMAMAERTINMLSDSPTKNTSLLIYTRLKFAWAAGNKAESLGHLRQLLTNLLADVAMETGSDGAQADVLNSAKPAELKKLISRCHFKIGQWEAHFADDWEGRNAQDIIHSYHFAIQFDRSWYKAWHTWAQANFEVVNYMEARSLAPSLEKPEDGLIMHILQAVDGFFQSISLSGEEALQDTLRLLTLWFKYGSINEVSDAMVTGFASVKVDTWLAVIPQIMARIQTPHINIRRNINNLLADIGKHHPQALIYPLVVGSKSPNASRRNAALAIIDRMRDRSSAISTIVSQALIVLRELVRVAILWHELWLEGLEEASYHFFTNGNLDGMLKALEPLHDLLDAGPTTSQEVSFIQAFGSELREAREATRRWRISGDTEELDRSWQIYFTVFKRIEKQQMKSLDLRYVSPSLLNARDLDLAVPGTYQSGRPVIKIVEFKSTLAIIMSKQRPRRLSLQGSDGREYQYVLKGHEDLRQDERVMQLFGLVNTLLSDDTESFKRRLHIQRYPVIPLAQNVGLLGWVQGSDTLHTLVCDYRDSHKVLLNLELNLILQMAPDYDNLALLQKIEVFEYVLNNTSGRDLYKTMWLKSADSEHWLERRVTYTRSLAVNSMVGHILGLGDRHPSNLLMERKTGKIIHIDFGDCFEVAMHREKFPERIPFRLTRMLVHAMEVSGIEGTFRKTCEITMKVLRGNKESLMAVLEAFIYDPVITWRLVQSKASVKVDGTAAYSSIRTGSHHSAGFSRTSGYFQPPLKLRANESNIFDDAQPDAQEVRNERALTVYNAVQRKLTGREFSPDLSLAVDVQVDRLVKQATSFENLCQCYTGWCAFW